MQDIPDQILAQVLKRLPVKSLLRCRCVQKSWYDLVQSSYFINLHLNYQQIDTTHHNPPPKYLIFQDIYANNILSLRYDDKQCQEFQLKLQIPPSLSANYTKLNISTCFSLICLYCHSTSFPRCVKYAFFDIYLWNPLVQKYKTLPNVPLIPPRLFTSRVYWRELAFGYVPQINDYRVVTILNYNDASKLRSFFICVYSLATDSWKKIIIQDNIFIEAIGGLFKPVILNGTAFWRGTTIEKVQILLCFDTMNDILGTVLLPKEAGHCRSPYPLMRQFGQSIVCIVDDPGEPALNMWALKEGPMNEFFWEKKISVSLKEIARLEFVGSRNNGEIIFPKLYDCDLVSYNVEKDEVNDFVHSWHRWFSHRIARGKHNDIDFDDRQLDMLVVPFCADPFVESLVLLDTD